MENDSIKKDLIELFNKKKINELKRLINKHYETLKDDVDFISIKSTLMIYEKKLNEAKKYLEENSSKIKNNFNCQLNLGYLYELEKNYDKAIELYVKAEFLGNKDEKKIIRNIFESLGSNDDLKHIIGKKYIEMYKQLFESICEDKNIKNLNYLSELVIKKFPNVALFNFWYALSLEFKGEKEKSNTYLKKAKKLDNSLNNELYQRYKNKIMA